MTTHSPAPWKWGAGWAEVCESDREGREEFAGPKYADIGLYDANGREILPLRVDHYAIIYDGYAADSKEADRRGIDQAPAMLDALRAAAEVAGYFYGQRAGCADTACRVCARNTEQYQRLDAARAIFAELDGTP